MDDTEHGQRLQYLIVFFALFALVTFVLLGLLWYEDREKTSPSVVVTQREVPLSASPWQILQQLWQRSSAFDWDADEEISFAWRQRMTEEAALANVLVTAWTPGLSESEVRNHVKTLYLQDYQGPLLIYVHPAVRFIKTGWPSRVELISLQDVWLTPLPREGDFLLLLSLFLSRGWQRVLWWDLKLCWISSPVPLLSEDKNLFWSTPEKWEAQHTLQLLFTHEQRRGLPWFHLTPSLLLWQRTHADHILKSAIQLITSRLHLLLPPPHDYAVSNALWLTVLQRGHTTALFTDVAQSEVLLAGSEITARVKGQRFCWQEQPIAYELWSKVDEDDMLTAFPVNLVRHDAFGQVEQWPRRHPGRKVVLH